MIYRVTVQPSSHGFDIEPGNTILRAALDAGVNLPYGCRNGACGSCKGRVLTGEVNRGDYQDQALTEQEVAAGYALFCCARPLSDLTIECREVGAVRDIPVRTMPCRVEVMERVAPDVMVLKLRLPANERLLFLAGQYIDILLKDGRRRSFSLANPPHDDDMLELHVRHIHGGYFSDKVFNEMKARDILRFVGPQGSFFLREDSKKPILLVAGGTGFAPIKAIIEHALQEKTNRPITLYWGAHDSAGLYRNELAQSWASLSTLGSKLRSKLSYVPVLSDEPAENGWTGRVGLVHEAVMEDMPDLSGYQVYACGAPAMIDAAKRDFVARCALPVEEFFADAFTFSADPLPA